MVKQFFITGTDTDVGKTYITVGLLNAFKQAGHSVLGLKPVASGCDVNEGQLRNSDALALQSASSMQVDYDLINPFAFTEAVAPHIASALDNKPIIFQALIEKVKRGLMYPADIHLIEGAGGWCVPLNREHDLYELAVHFNWPVILVIKIGLGCLNHAFLTERAILSAKLPFAGWVANYPSKEGARGIEITETLKMRLKAPCLGEVFFGEDPAEKLNLQDLW